jgi:hypothetical protein
MSIFKSYSREVEAAFGMFSVALDEAISLRDNGFVAHSLQVSVLMSGLCKRFTDHLEDVLLSMEEHSTLHRTTPSVAALNSADFRSHRGVRSALTSYLWLHALFSQHARFLSKVHALRRMVACIGRDVRMAAEELTPCGEKVESGPLWSSMAVQYLDLNTCLRESLILLKCFLRVLPDDEVRPFQGTVSKHGTRRDAAREGTTIPASVVRDKPLMRSSSPGMLGTVQTASSR